MVILGGALALVSPEPARGEQADGTPPPGRAEVGEWSAVQNWPITATHAALLPTGKVLFVGEFDEGLLAPRLWDPSTRRVERIDFPGYNVFCAGHTQLADGSLLFAGGHAGDSHFGEREAIALDPFTRRWTRLPPMNAGRWYPTATTLASGEVLVVSGEVAGNGDLNRLPQVFDPVARTWRDLTRALRTIPFYPRMFAAPNGKVFVAGTQQMTYYLDPVGDGAWTMVGRSRHGGRDYGAAVLYDAGKVLLVGGDDPPTATAEVIDLGAARPAWRSTGTMSVPRRQLNATALPDGTVLVTGGSSGAGFDDGTSPALAAELWNPATGRWTTLAEAARYRGYHSTALLLPDGRVLNAGGRKEQTAQVYSPPYLFKGPRPVITAAPASIAPGATFRVETGKAGRDVAQVTFLRLGAVTHAFDQSQRFLRLGFTRAGDAVEVRAPSTNRLAPPGHYLLFVLDAEGVPSVARIVRMELGADAPEQPPVPAPDPPPPPRPQPPSAPEPAQPLPVPAPQQPAPPLVFPVDDFPAPERPDDDGAHAGGAAAGAGGGGCGQAAGSAGPVSALLALAAAWRAVTSARRRRTASSASRESGRETR